MSKVISVSNKVYRALVSIKGRRSFSEVIEEALSGKGNKELILSMAGSVKLNEKKIRKARKELEKEFGRRTSG